MLNKLLSMGGMIIEKIDGSTRKIILPFCHVVHHKTHA
jgi:hypothetical protein